MKGLFRVKLIAANFPDNRILGSGEVFVEFRLGDQKKSIRGEGYHFKAATFGEGVIIFDAQTNPKLQIFAHQHQGDPEHDKESVVYGEINLAYIETQINTRHLIKVHCVPWYEGGVLKEEEAGVLDVEIFYNHELNGILEMKVESAILDRDTDAIGNMDPYVEVTIEGVTKKTMVKRGAGKMPIWNQHFVFEPKTTEAKLDLQVKDEDLTTSDLVGVSSMSLRGNDFMQPSTEFIGRGIPLFYKQDQAGTLNILTRFTFR